MFPQSRLMQRCIREITTAVDMAPDTITGGMAGYTGHTRDIIITQDTIKHTEGIIVMDISTME